MADKKSLYPVEDVVAPKGTGLASITGEFCDIETERILPWTGTVAFNTERLQFSGAGKDVKGSFNILDGKVEGEFLTFTLRYWGTNIGIRFVLRKAEGRKWKGVWHESGWNLTSDPRTTLADFDAAFWASAKIGALAACEFSWEFLL